jgi:BASS family bile acid:Na+ symporter
VDFLRPKIIGGIVLIKKILRFAVKNMALFVVLIGVIGANWPWTLSWVGPVIPWMLGIVMFGMGMTLKVDDFRFILHRPWEVAIGAFAQFTIMPFVAWALVKLFNLPPELAIGVILVGTCPGGTASNVITYLAKGDVALSVAMTCCTTLLAPIVTPVLTYYLAGSWIEISLTAMMVSIAKMVLLPVLGGLFVNTHFESKVAPIREYMPFVSVVCIVLLVGGVVSLSASRLFESGALIAGVVVLHNLFGLLLGYGMARLFRMSPAKTRAVAIEVGMQNSGLAASLAVMYFTPAGAIAGAIFSVWHNISGSLLANYFTRHDEAKAVAAAENTGSAHN